MSDAHADPAGGFVRGPATVVYETERFTVVRAPITHPDGSGSHREFLASPGAVTIVPLDGDDVILVRQYRVAADTVLLELPAGRLEPGEDPAGCAARELIEETGYAAGSLVELSRYFATPGMTDHKMVLYLATGLTAAERSPQSAEEEAMQVVRVPFAQAVAMAADGRLTDAKTMLGLLLADVHLRTEGTAPSGSRAVPPA